MNIQYGIGKGLGHREISYSMGVNAYFGTRRADISHATPNYGPVRSKFEVDYYRQTYRSPEKVVHIRRKRKEKSGQEVMYSSNFFNSIFTEFFGYETSDKLIWKPGEGFRNKNTISKEGIPKININMTYNSSTLGFGC